MRTIRPDVFAVGAIDFDVRLFDRLIPLPDGTSYNAYLVKGSEKTALLDTVDPTMRDVLLKNLSESGVSKIDYVISPIKGDFKLLKKYFKTKTKWYSKVIYPNPVDFEKIDKEVDPIDEKFNFKKNGGKLLLLGNSGAPTNNHLDIMIRLSEMKEQNFKIICPLSYGSPIYMKKIIIKGKKIFGDRFIPLLEFLKPDIYFHILKQIDLAIMYHNRQQGVGTINILLYMGKPLCMKKTSLFFYLKEKGVSFFPSQDFEKLILNEIEFTEAMSEKNKKFVSQIQSINSVISSIDNLLNILEDRNDS